MAEDKVRKALALLKQAGCMDLVQPAVLGPLRPVRRACVGVAAAVMACSPPRAARTVSQVRRGGRDKGGPGRKGAAWAAGGARKEVLDFDDTEPGEQIAARKPWREEKAGPEAACWMASAGVRRFRWAVWWSGFCAHRRRGGATSGPIRRLALSLAGHSLPHHHVRLKVGVREDLQMWNTFLDTFNGISLKAWQDCEWDVQIFWDEAGAAGFGIYWEGRWCAEEWLTEWKNGGRSIAFLELFPLAVAVCLWGSPLWHKCVLFRVDNLAVVQLVNQQLAQDVQVLQLLRVFVLRCLQNDIFFRALHVPGVNNDKADALSRSQWDRFHGVLTSGDSTPIGQACELIRVMLHQCNLYQICYLGDAETDSSEIPSR
ncbi:hypothetical protein NDU88_004528 [Pleurodeles waltl]|uniref:RNase H type-1 domain-containing protein n=1 Tax=Pleurodeles waltl TaxID=8319 RepID=A0AAV7UFG7_PLEWA|nr:hypothetical protein NDU88_004528 [Pleurodeles waltl]